MATKNTKSINTTTIRIETSIKEQLENLDFVRKDTYNQILLKLIEFYNSHNRQIKMLTITLNNSEITDFYYVDTNNNIYSFK